MLKVVLIGCAHVHTLDYLRAIQSAGDIKVAAVYDRNFDNAKVLADQLGAALAANDGEIHIHQPDGAIVLSETVHHEIDVNRALRLKCPLFVEKPLGMEGEAAGRIAKAITESGTTFHTGFFLRTIPAFQRLRQVLNRNELGQVSEAYFRFAHDGAIKGWLDNRSWITDPTRAGYGAFGDLSIHGADLLAWLLGEEILSGAAIITRTLALACDDHGTAVLSFGSGTVGTLSTSWIDPSPRLDLRITGLEGVAEINGDNHLVIRNTAQSAESKVMDATKSEDLGEVRLDAADGLLPFIRVLRSSDDSADLIPVADALAANKIIDLLYRKMENI
jgi:predicted dehydrogenase